jgi:uncharacterized LabA/DUF88 family protein
LKPTIEMMTAHEVPDASQAAGKSDTTGVEKPAEDKPPVKGNVDADLVLYAMKEMPNYEKAIIVSGDGDFHGLIEYLAQQGRLANVLTPNWQYSSLLKQFEDYIVRLDQLRRQLEYHDRSKNKQRSEPLNGS